MELRNTGIKNYISSVDAGSIAEELGIVAGDCIRSINGVSFEDIIEFTFLQSDDEIELEIEKANGDSYIYEIEKDYDEEIGITFSNPIMDSVKTCNNDCVFCFVNQLPEGMRETLYIKDDDSRLSFLQGNFITMTNMKDVDIERMIQYRISPVNVSVHTTDPKLRAAMLHNRHAGDILNKMQRLADAGLSMNGQIVCVPGYNDKEELVRTIQDLARLHPRMISVAVVPVGLTKHRSGLPKLELFDKVSARELLRQIHILQEVFLRELGTRFVFASDEFYVMAKEELPPDEAYEGYIQVENGVGLMRRFEVELLAELKKNKYLTASDKIKKVTIATGTSAYRFMGNMAKLVGEHIQGIELQVQKVENRFFGETITVAGLITGKDLLEQLAQIDIGDALLLPRVMFRSDEPVFLDDMTLEELSHQLSVPVVAAEVSGNDFIESLIAIRDRE